MKRAAGDRPRPSESARDDPIAPFEQALGQAFPSRDALLKQAREQTERQRRRKRAATSTATLAAVALAVLAWADPVWQRETLQSAVGETAAFSLADGSTITLGADTAVSAEWRLFSRQFTLTRGEAMFDVGKDTLRAWRPFIVHADGVRVRDIGTRFDVKLGARRLQVTVAEGIVEVTPAHAGSAPQRVLAGQAWTQVRTPRQRTAPTVGAADVAAATAWQRGKLVFDGTPLEDALAEVQRHRRAPVRIADDQAARMRISGEYDAAGIEALLDALPQTLPVRLQRDADGTVTIRSR